MGFSGIYMVSNFHEAIYMGLALTNVKFNNLLSFHENLCHWRQKSLESNITCWFFLFNLEVNILEYNYFVIQIVNF